jgi:hypothetical protein
MDTRDFIENLRGGVPDKCSFCHAVTPPEHLHPEEGGEWACEDCLRNWEANDEANRDGWR